MLKRASTFAIASALAASMAVAANAQNTTTTPSDPPASTTTTPSATPDTTTSPSATDPSTSTPSSTTTAPSSSSTASAAPMMTDEEAKNWVNKTVYSSDGKNLGEVAEILRDNSGHVTELHADIGGFLGLGETRVKVMPDQFKLASDRVILNLPGDQAQSLPHLKK